jgi:hypothetical protein
MANGYNIPAPRGYFPPQTNLRVATPIVGQTGLPSNTNVQQPSPFYDMRPYQEFFGDPTRDLLASTRAAIAARTKQPTATPQTRFTGQEAPASYMSPALSQMPSQQVTPRTPPSGLDQLRAAQLRMPAKGSPELAGLSAAAATGLQLSGYQDRPLTTGQIVGSMLGTYNEAQQAAAQRQAEAAAVQRDIEQQEFANALKVLELEAAGIKRLQDLASEADKAETQTAQDIAKYTNELADDFRTENKEFDSAFTSFRKVTNAATKPDPTGADDIALIFGFMKVLDPNSVVREGEFATAQNSGSVPQSILAVYNQVLSGTRLTPDQRTNFLNSAQDQFSPYVELRNRLEDRYTNRASGLNVNVNNIFDPIVGTEQFIPRIVETLEQGDALPSGTFYTVRGSGVTRKVD